MPRFDHVCFVVDDVDAAVGFFDFLGFEREGRVVVEGEDVDRINGLDGVRAEILMVRAPDGSGKLELVKYIAPADGNGADAAPANRPGLRHICLEIEDLDGILDGLRDQGFDTVGEVRAVGNAYRTCYVRGPEGLIVELAERLSS
jgi:catechol 2,3-dioxygenase-like lactoylglutathione lyase family enzyme